MRRIIPNREWASKRPVAALAFCAGVTLVCGCNNAHAPRLTRSTAPSLRDDAGLAARGGSNPNGPYLVADSSTHLVKRPTTLDINASSPCIASQLSLFESGAHIDGDRRSLRLNLVNHGAAPCRLGGYPSVSLLREDGSLLGNIAIEKVSSTTLEAAFQQAPSPKHEAQPSPMVMLPPSGEATFEIGWTGGRSGSSGVLNHCDQVGAVAVSAPGTTQSFTIRHGFSVCEGRILITAIADGAQL